MAFFASIFALVRLSPQLVAHVGVECITFNKGNFTRCQCSPYFDQSVLLINQSTCEQFYKSRTAKRRQEVALDKFMPLTVGNVVYLDFGTLMLNMTSNRVADKNQSVIGKLNESLITCEHDMAHSGQLNQMMDCNSQILNLEHQLMQLHRPASRVLISQMVDAQFGKRIDPMKRELPYQDFMLLSSRFAVAFSRTPGSGVRVTLMDVAGGPTAVLERKMAMSPSAFKVEFLRKWHRFDDFTLLASDLRRLSPLQPALEEFLEKSAVQMRRVRFALFVAASLAALAVL